MNIFDKKTSVDLTAIYKVFETEKVIVKQEHMLGIRLCYIGKFLCYLASGGLIWWAISLFGLLDFLIKPLLIISCISLISGLVVLIKKITNVPEYVEVEQKVIKDSSTVNITVSVNKTDDIPCSNDFRENYDDFYKTLVEFYINNEFAKIPKEEGDIAVEGKYFYLDKENKRKFKEFKDANVILPYDPYEGMGDV